MVNTPRYLAIIIPDPNDRATHAYMDVQGTPVAFRDFEDYSFFVYQNTDRICAAQQPYAVAEFTTGVNLGYGSTADQAIAYASRALLHHGRQGFLQNLTRIAGTRGNAHENIASGRSKLFTPRPSHLCDKCITQPIDCRNPDDDKYPIVTCSCYTPHLCESCEIKGDKCPLPPPRGAVFECPNHTTPE